MMVDYFIGVWILDSDQSDYQVGEPPKTGKYTIEAEGSSYNVTMAWTTQHDDVMSASYVSVPDGKKHAYEDSDAVDFVRMTRVDEKTLDSESFKNENRIAWARRVLSDDNNIMTITQSGYLPDGSKFNNVSVYKRNVE